MQGPAGVVELADSAEVICMLRARSELIWMAKAWLPRYIFVLHGYGELLGSNLTRDRYIFRDQI